MQDEVGPFIEVDTNSPPPPGTTNPVPLLLFDVTTPQDSQATLTTTRPPVSTTEASSQPAKASSRFSSGSILENGQAERAYPESPIPPASIIGISIGASVGLIILILVFLLAGMRRKRRLETQGAREAQEEDEVLAQVLATGNANKRAREMGVERLCKAVDRRLAAEQLELDFSEFGAGEKCEELRQRAKRDEDVLIRLDERGELGRRG